MKIENKSSSMNLVSYRKSYFSNKQSITWKSDKLEPMIITPVKLNGLDLLALWDSGTELSIISSDLSRKLNLVEIGESFIRNFDSLSSQKRPVYCADLFLHKNVVIGNIGLVGGFDKLSNDFDIILGLSVMCEGKSIIDGSKGKSIFKFII